MDDLDRTTVSEWVWMIASIGMFTLMVLHQDAFMVLLLPWIIWGFCHEAYLDERNEQRIRRNENS